MDWITPQLVGLAAVGLVSGVLSGMLGVGGATLSTPGARLFGATPVQAVGSTIPAVIPSAIAGSIRYAREGLVDWRLALTTGGAGAVAAVGGAMLSDHIDAHLLMLLTAVVLLGSGLALRDRSSARRPSPAHPAFDMVVNDAQRGGAVMAPVAVPVPAVADDRVGATVLLLAVGAAAGLVAGLLGIGGGVILMPLFTGFLRVPVKRAVASSLVAVAVFSVPALAAHALLGHIDWAIAAALCVGVIPGARIGSRFTMGASERTVKALFGTFLVVLALVYGATEVHGLLAVL